MFCDSQVRCHVKSVTIFVHFVDNMRFNAHSAAICAYTPCNVSSRRSVLEMRRLRRCTNAICNYVVSICDNLCRSLCFITHPVPNRCYHTFNFYYICNDNSHIQRICQIHDAFGYLFELFSTSVCHNVFRVAVVCIHRVSQSSDAVETFQRILISHECI